MTILHLYIVCQAQKLFIILKFRRTARTGLKFYTIDLFVPKVRKQDTLLVRGYNPCDSNPFRKPNKDRKHPCTFHQLPLPASSGWNGWWWLALIDNENQECTLTLLLNRKHPNVSVNGGRPHSASKEMRESNGDSADSRVTRYFIRFFTGAAGATRRRWRRALSNN